MPSDSAEGPFNRWAPGSTAPFALASDESLFTLLPTDSDVTRDSYLKWSDIAQCIHVFPPYLLAVGHPHTTTQVFCLSNLPNHPC